MSRVNSYAGRVGGETIDGWLAGRKWTPQRNDEFIATMKADGRQFLDIGPDFECRLKTELTPALEAQRARFMEVRGKIFSITGTINNSTSEQRNIRVEFPALILESRINYE